MGDATATRTDKRLLLVDDDEEFRTSLKTSLERSGYAVVLAQGGRVAQHFLASEKFDAVISDVRMPDGDGLSLVRYARDTQPSLPLILMTGFAKLAETHEAHGLGVEDFIAKPFEKSEMLAALDRCFARQSGKGLGPASEAPEEYFKIAIDDFISGSTLQSDIFIRLSADKHVKIAHKGELLPVEQIKKYSAKGIRHLYLGKSDFAAYVGMNLNLTQAVKDSTRLTKERKQQFMKHAAEIVLEKIYSEELNKDCFDDAKDVLDATLSVLSEDTAAFSLLGMLEGHSDHLYAHSLGVSIYSSMIARQLQWHSTATSAKLSMGGLFHDIGQKEIERSILDKARRNMTIDEIKLYERHCMRGMELLGEIRSIPSDVLQIVQQHHEDCLGQGFPAGLKKNSIHPLARVVAVANSFCNLVLLSANGPGLKLVEALPRLLTTSAQTLDPAVFAGLLKIFNFEVPPHYAAELKKRLEN